MMRKTRRSPISRVLSRLPVKLPVLVGIGAIALLIVVIVIRAAAYAPLSTEPDVPAFLARYGWQVESSPAETREVVIPAEFSAVYQNYNDMQKAQGFDLSKYRGQTAVQYSYKITNHEAGTDVFANVLVIGGRIVGGDLCSYALEGFLSGF